MPTDRTALVALMLAVDDSLQAALTVYQNGAMDVPHLLFVVQAECERLRFAALAAPTPGLIAEASGWSPDRAALVIRLREHAELLVTSWGTNASELRADLREAAKALAVLGAPTPRPEQEKENDFSTHVGTKADAEDSRTGGKDKS